MGQNGAELLDQINRLIDMRIDYKDAEIEKMREDIRMLTKERDAYKMFIQSLEGMGAASRALGTVKLAAQRVLNAWR